MAQSYFSPSQHKVWTWSHKSHTNTKWGHTTKHTHTPQSGLHGHVSSTSCKHYCVWGDRDHWNLIVWGNIHSAFHGESDKQCCERWPGQTLSLLLCCDRCPLCLFFLIALETGHPTTEKDNKKDLGQNTRMCLHCQPRIWYYPLILIYPPSSGHCVFD